MKLVKISLVSLGVLVTLFIVAAVILVATVDPNEYKGEIAKAVKENTGRELKFEGDIGFNFFPWLGLNVGPMALGNAPGFSPAEMIRINKAEASIQIMPLLSGKVSIGTVVLDGFTANLSVNKAGVTNWDDLAKGKESAQETQEQTVSEDKTGDGGKLESLSVLGVEITNANVTYDDKKSGKLASLTDLNLIIGEVGDKLPTPFSLVFDLKLNDPKIETRPTLKGNATFDMEAKTFEITEMIFDILGMNLTGNVFAKANSAVSYSSEFKLAKFDPRELMKMLGIESPKTTDPDALGALSADIKINGTENTVSLESLTVLLDDTTISGTGSVKNFAKPAIDVGMNINDIDVDRYMPPQSDQPAAKAAAPAKTEDTAPAQEPDLSGLREQDIKAKLTIGKLKAMNLRISEILCQLRIKDGMITVKPFSANLYDGNLTGQSVLNANVSPAKWQETAVLKGVQAGPMLKDFMGKDHILGAMGANYSLTGAGLTPPNIKKTISGKASFAFTDGAINGVNIAKMLRDAINSIKGKTASASEPEKTDFAELSGSADLHNGHIANNDLLMKSPLLRLTGNGWVNLPNNKLDYKTRVKVVGTLKGQDGEAITELTGLTIPVYAKGSLDAPSIGLDTKALAEALLKNSTKDLGKKLQESISKDKDSKGGVGGLIKSLF